MKILKTTKYLIALFAFTFGFYPVKAQDSCFIKLHFLHGSKPKKAYKNTESKWLGGRLGGHVGIETDSNKVIDFVPDGKFHWFAKNNDKHSRFVSRDVNGFWAVFGGSSEAAMKTTVSIPITKSQKHILDSISMAYLGRTPYDYAFLGMRCAAAAYDILGHSGVVKKYRYGRTWRKIFYPRILRRKILKQAAKNGWPVETQKGTNRRKWEG